jgi:hypothetical protein
LILRQSGRRDRRRVGDDLLGTSALGRLAASDRGELAAFRAEDFAQAPEGGGRAGRAQG